MVEYITYRKKKYPVRVSYRALRGFKKDTGIGFDDMTEDMDIANYEPLLYHALISGADADEIKMAFKREEIESVLDECMMEFVALIPGFFPDNEQGKRLPNRLQRRKKEREKTVKKKGSQ